MPLRCAPATRPDARPSRGPRPPPVTRRRCRAATAPAWGHRRAIRRARGSAAPGRPPGHGAAGIGRQRDHAGLGPAQLATQHLRRQGRAGNDTSTMSRSSEPSGAPASGCGRGRSAASTSDANWASSAGRRRSAEAGPGSPSSRFRHQTAASSSAPSGPAPGSPTPRTRAGRRAASSRAVSRIAAAGRPQVSATRSARSRPATRRRCLRRHRRPSPARSRAGRSPAPRAPAHAPGPEPAAPRCRGVPAARSARAAGGGGGGIDLDVERARVAGRQPQAVGRVGQRGAEAEDGPGACGSRRRRQQGGARQRGERRGRRHHASGATRYMPPPCRCRNSRYWRESARPGRRSRMATADGVAARARGGQEAAQSIARAAAGVLHLPGRVAACGIAPAGATHTRRVEAHLRGGRPGAGAGGGRMAGLRPGPETYEAPTRRARRPQPAGHRVQVVSRQSQGPRGGRAMRDQFCVQIEASSEQFPGQRREHGSGHGAAHELQQTSACQVQRHRTCLQSCVPTCGTSGNGPGRRARRGT